MSRVGESLSRARQYLVELGVDEAKANAEIILAEILKTGRNELAMQAGQPLTARQDENFWRLVRQRGERIPLAYLLGFQHFLGLKIMVSRSTLIPRPETEEVVMEAARLLKPRSKEILQLLEIGTGTGCIAIALSQIFPQALVYATEISPAALELARKNAQAHNASISIRLIAEDLFKPGSLRLPWADLIISNPPYIPTAEIDSLAPEVRQEPRLALDGGKDGLKALRSIISQAPTALKPGGHLVLEIGAGQGRAVLRLLESASFKDASIQRDMQGHERIATAKMLK